MRLLFTKFNNFFPCIFAWEEKDPISLLALLWCFEFRREIALTVWQVGRHCLIFANEFLGTGFCSLWKRLNDKGCDFSKSKLNYRLKVLFCFLWFSVFIFLVCLFLCWDVFKTLSIEYGILWFSSNFVMLFFLSCHLPNKPNQGVFFFF